MASSSLQHDVNLSKEGKCDYTLLVTGVTGSGKSSLCNFLSCSKTAFEASCGFASVTERSAAAIITMQGKRVKLIDTPGFCDDYETEEEHMNEFGEAVVLASKGVNGIGLVISAKGRYGTNEKSTIDQLSQFQELWPFMFIIFTHARSLGATEEDQNKQLQSNFTESRCPESLKVLMQKVNNRYILVESIKPSDNPEEYYQRKTKELEAMISSICEANGFQVYTNELFNITKAALDKAMKEKNEVAKELKMARKQADENIKKRMEDEKAQKEAKLQMQIAEEKQKEIEQETDEKRRSILSSTQEEVMQKEKEKEEVKKELDKHYLEKQQLEKKLAEDEENRRIKQQAMENIKKQIEEERKQHEALKSEELKEKPAKKWYKFLYKKPKEINN